MKLLILTASVDKRIDTKDEIDEFFRKNYSIIDDNSKLTLAICSESQFSKGEYVLTAHYQV